MNSTAILVSLCVIAAVLIFGVVAGAIHEQKMYDVWLEDHHCYETPDEGGYICPDGAWHK